MEPRILMERVEARYRIQIDAIRVALSKKALDFSKPPFPNRDRLFSIEMKAMQKTMRKRGYDHGCDADKRQT